MLDRGTECKVGVVTLCSSAAGAATVVVVKGQVGLAVVPIALLAGGVELEGRRGRLAAWASSAEETSWFAGMA